MSVLFGIARADAPAAVREAKLYGGQAVIEGVLMKSARRAVVSVRESIPYVKDEKGKWIDPSRDWAPEQLAAHEEQRKIVSEELWQVEGVPKKSWKQLPFIRGAFVLFESLSLGTKALEFSAKVAGQGMDEEPEPTIWSKILSYGLSIGFAVLLFHVLPNFIAESAGNALHLPAKDAAHLNPFEPAAMTKNVIDGVVRILFFALYILVIRSLFKEIYRVFQYHGAEHKTVNAYEAAVPLTVESVQKMPTFHRRCGTSFVFLVGMVSILMHVVTGWHPDWWFRIGRNLLLLLPVASVSYELLRLTAAYPKATWSNLVSLPGIGFQKITALEPSDRMVEVAIDAFRQVMDDADVVQAQPQLAMAAE